MADNSRTRRLALSLALAAVASAGQTDSPRVLHTITGHVRDAASGQPLSGCKVSTYNGEKMTVSTDDHGVYSFPGLPDGRYNVAVFANRRFLVRVVTLTGSAPDATIDFDVPGTASIAGVVQNPQGEPLPGAFVVLYSKEYQGGLLRFVAHANTETNAKGEYQFRFVEPNRMWYVLAQRGDLLNPPVSNAPRDPKARKPVMVSTWFPDSPDASGAAPVIVQQARPVEAIDIRMLQSSNLCVSGVLEAGGRPAALTMYIDEEAVIASQHRIGHTRADGRFRICGLYPGAYRLSAHHLPAAGSGEAPLFASVPFVVDKTDVAGIILPVQPGFRTEGKAVFADRIPGSREPRPPSSGRSTDTTSWARCRSPLLCRASSRFPPGSPTAMSWMPTAAVRVCTSRT